MNQITPVGAITAAVSSAATLTGGGSITIATVTTTAPGILGAIGLTTTSAVAVPVAAVAAVAVVAGVGIFYGVKMAQDWNNGSQTP